MSQDRNMKWLNERRVRYRQDPINDKPTEETSLYRYYAGGTYECYHLFRSKAKITTYRSLKWHFLVLYYLNQENGLLPSHVYEFIADKQNGFVTFFISDKKLQEMIDDVFNTGGEPPVNKMRKIIFKDYCGLTPSEKMSIVGRLIGRSSRVDAEAIYQAMLDISYKYENITWSKIAGLLDCSTRTVQRNLTKQLRDEKEILNMENEKI
mgnify:FL=1|jgi:hypothetical protein|tara:strand:+ start:24 stop:647 length:624 start_codon:yes stop_codon:yes gene_type:complete